MSRTQSRGRRGSIRNESTCRGDHVSMDTRISVIAGTRKCAGDDEAPAMR